MGFNRRGHILDCPVDLNPPLDASSWVTMSRTEDIVRLAAKIRPSNLGRPQRANPLVPEHFFYYPWSTSITVLRIGPPLTQVHGYVSRLEI